VDPVNIYYVDGQFVEDREAKISVEDMAVLRGFAAFDFLRTYNGAPFHLQEHLLRLQRSAKLIGLQLPHTVDEMDRIVRETLAKNDHPESYIRIVITGGTSPDGITPGDNPRLLVMITPAKSAPVVWRQEGVRIITCHVDRYMPGAKSTNYIPAIICQAEARSRQAIESVYVDRDGYLLEATTSNLVVVIGDTLVTPPCDRILQGITRQVVLDLARMEFNVEVRRLHKDEIGLLDEAFLTSTTKEVLPVIAIDSVTIGSGKPGPRTLRIMEMFRECAAANT
jgi:branched-chain amino acid aminotransferase